MELRQERANVLNKCANISGRTSKTIFTSFFKKELDVAAEFISAHAGYTSRGSDGLQFLPGKITECFAATRY
ncbi:hypothetical protein [Burkholderia lata]|uniref:hypothetical protein n=1 Tax=Burkholderia lata (strain ATCC 17760 / DSM 23089 / LMG 22485 / NCIMB 9086 / R18194 / 383) TaxID=482957 RepID=UPI0015844147|nr:hypothetical protein [Burkholderia lata]